MKIMHYLCLLFFIGVTHSACKKNSAYSSEYEYPTILNIAGSTDITTGATGFTSKYYTYYLGPSVSLAWSSSAPADVTVTPATGDPTTATFLFKPSAAGKKITVTVKSSTGITGTLDVTVH